MKKLIAALIVLCMVFSMTLASAQTVEEDLAASTIALLEEYEVDYEYYPDENVICFVTALESSLEEADTYIYIYDDMIAVAVDCPLTVPDALFEKMAVFIALANSTMYYAQFRLNRDTGLLTCRACNVIENVVAGEAEIETLIIMASYDMMLYGDAIASIILEDADPYEAFAAVEE